MAQRVKSEADAGGGRRDAIPADHICQLPRDMGRIHPGLQVDRNTGFEGYSLKQPSRRSVALKPKTIRPDRAAEHQGEPGRTVLKIVQRLGVGTGRIRKLHTLDDPPRPPCSVAEYRARAASALIERRNGDAVVAFRYQPLFEGCAFDRARYERKPLLLARRRKLGKCQFVRPDDIVTHGSEVCTFARIGQSNVRWN